MMKKGHRHTRQSRKRRMIKIVAATIAVFLALAMVLSSIMMFFM